VTFLQWLQKAESRGLDVVAITDHNTVEGIARLRAEIERLAWLEANDRLRPQERRELDEFRRLGDRILVLPGFEFTATFGFHILATFPPDTSLRLLELLLLRLNVPVDRLGDGSTEVGPTTDVLTAYRTIHEAGGLVIAAHANSTHGVALQGLGFGGQTKIAFTQDPYLDALEVTDLDSSSRRATARFFDGSKPEYPRRMHCIQGSDAHRLTRDLIDKNRLGIGDRATEALLLETSFEALRDLFESNDFTRTRPFRPLAETPYDPLETAREQGPNIVQSFQEGMSREGGRLHKILADVVAFANTRGGTLYIGASPTRRLPPRGVEGPDEAAFLVRQEIEQNVFPTLDATVDVIRSQGVPIVRVNVPSGPDKPYALGLTRIYVRQESETNEAVRDELVQLVLSGSQGVRPSQVVTEHVPAAQPEPVFVAQPAAAVALVSQAAGEAGLPTIGVEIVSSEERRGTRYYTIRDLRNGSTVQNVTLGSARKLWSYAITQFLAKAVEGGDVSWHGEHGLWQAGRRADKMRYDLVLRQPDGSLRVFYGVTADGMTGPWAQFLRAEDKFEQGEAVQVEEGLEANGDATKSRRRRRGGRGRGRSGADRTAEAEAMAPSAESAGAEETQTPPTPSTEATVAPVPGRTAQKSRRSAMPTPEQAQSALEAAAAALLALPSTERPSIQAKRTGGGRKPAATLPAGDTLVTTPQPTKPAGQPRRSTGKAGTAPLQAEVAPAAAEPAPAPERRKRSGAAKTGRPAPEATPAAPIPVLALPAPEQSSAGAPPDEPTIVVITAASPKPSRTRRKPAALEPVAVLVAAPATAPELPAAEPAARKSSSRRAKATPETES
jgi:hypothetical protein